jgi:hypothetical protein
MEIVQTYETTIGDSTGMFSLSVLVIPARAYQTVPPDQVKGFAGFLFESENKGGIKWLEPAPQVRPDMLLDVIGGNTDAEEARFFASYAACARVIPFEQSPLGAESLASIAVSSVKAGTIGLGATVGFLAAGQTPFLLITVPLGIVLCGVSVSFAKWLEENRTRIWDKLLAQQPKPSMDRALQHH